MSKNNLELGVWGDGTTRIAFWDSLHGDDQFYTLYGTGQVLKEHGEQKHWLTAVEFVQELRRLAQGWDEQNQRVSAWMATANFLYYWWKK